MLNGNGGGMLRARRLGIKSAGVRFVSLGTRHKYLIVMRE